MDLEILLMIQNLSNPLFDAIGKIFNILGEKGWIFIACSLILMINKKTRVAGFVLFIVLGITGLSTEIIKEFVERPRPFVAYPSIAPLYNETSLYSSFPSGHTSMAFAFATTMALFYPKYKFPLFTMAIIMGFTRLYGFVHYPTDVIAGAMIGIIVAIVVYKIYLKINKRKNCLIK